MTEELSRTDPADAPTDEWHPDILGDEYRVRRIELPEEHDGPLDATLVRRLSPHRDGRGVLYLHGFSDYFFQTGLADYFTGQGIDFYALDLRRYGRSLRPHHVPNYVNDLRDYFTEISAAIRIMRQDGVSRIAMNAHSTGGLIAALWAHEFRDSGHDGAVEGLMLNSPWFDVSEPLPVRLLARPAMEILGKVRPTLTLPWLKTGDAYGRSLHRDYHGEWTFDLTPKPIGGFPVRAGWLRAIMRAHRRLHAGLSVPCPVLVLCSARSIPRGSGGALLTKSDAVLDVEKMARWSVALGPQVTICRVDGGIHDLILSPVPVRKRVYEEMSAWLDLHFPAGRP